MRTIGKCCGHVQDSVCSYCGTDVDPIGEGNVRRPNIRCYHDNREVPVPDDLHAPRPQPTSVPGPGVRMYKDHKQWYDVGTIIVIIYVAVAGIILMLGLNGHFG